MFQWKEESILFPNSLILIKYDIFISIHNESFFFFPGAVQSKKES